MPLPAADPPGIACCRDYRLVFQDDFDALNREVWAPPPAHGTEWAPGAVRVKDSVLTIRANLASSPPWEGGSQYVEVWSLGRQAPSYPRYPNAERWEEGYFEIRASAAALPASGDAWIKLALWFFSYEWKNAYPDPACPVLQAEWDMVENGIGGTLPANDRHTSVIHRNTTGLCSISDSSVAKTADGTNLLAWHTWGGLWRGGRLSTYLDGVLQTTHVPYDSTAQPMAMVLMAAAQTVAPAGHEADPVPNFIETYVDWVRVWQ